MDVDFDVWFSEQSLVDRQLVEATLGDLRAHGEVYEDDGAIWLRTTDFGDDKDRVLVQVRRRAHLLRCPTSPTTATSSSRGFDRVIDIWGADHHGYVPPDAGGDRGARRTTPASSRSSSASWCCSSAAGRR